MFSQFYLVETNFICVSCLTLSLHIPALISSQLLSSLHRLLLAYFPSISSHPLPSLSLSEDSVKDHFSTVLSVIEEAMVAGLPLSLEPCVLKASGYCCVDSHKWYSVTASSVAFGALWGAH